MSYIGKAPIDRILGLSQKNVFAGDGSTTSFDMTSAAPEGGDTAVDVFVDNVRQEPGVGKGYVLAQDGSSEWTRITFSAAPVSGAVIWTNNRLRTQITNTLPGSGTVTAALLATDSVITIKILDANVTTAKIADDNVTTAKIADNNVTLAKLSDGTQGGTIYYGASGAPTELGAGTSGQFLKTLGTSANPAWGTVALTTINTNADDRVITGSGTADTLNGETNLTYDQTTLAIKNSGTASDIKVYCESSNAHYTSIKSAAHAAYTGGSWTFTLPGTDGASGEFLTTNGSGLSSWASVPAGAPTGGGSDKVFFENEQTVDTDYTLTTSNNAVSAGPVTVSAGITVTVPAGAAWVIV